jgi:hypothetical protein
MLQGEKKHLFIRDTQQASRRRMGCEARPTEFRQMGEKSFGAFAKDFHPYFTTEERVSRLSFKICQTLRK